MPNVPDNEMEHFFRESADNYEIEFNEAAWKKMEKKLDKEDRKVFWWRMGILLSLGLIVLMAGLFIFYPWFMQDSSNESPTKETVQVEPPIQKQGDNDNTTQNRQESTKQNPVSDEKGEKTKSELNKNTNDNEQDDKLKATIIGNGNKTGDALADADVNTVNNGTHSNVVDDTKHKSKVPILLDNEKKDKEEDTTGSEEKEGEEYNKSSKLDDDVNIILPILPDNEDAKNTTGTLEDGEKLDGKLSAIQEENQAWEAFLSKLIAIEKFPPSVLLSNTPDKDSLSIEMPKGDTTTVAQKAPREKSLFLNFSISPDLSGVGGITNHSGMRGGLKSGLLLEYQPLDRWSFYGGAYLSKKRYVAGVKDYTVPRGFWSGDLPTDIDADCNILEIPVGFRFQWLKKQNYSVFASAGISSYLILKEEYTYNYDLPYPPDRTGWLGRNENYHWFGVTTFSVGYEKKLGRKSSFLISPYIHLPLNGVGFGQVDLFSYGTYLTLKYRLK